MDDLHIWLAIAVMSIVTAATRFLPFLLFSGKKKTPKLIERLGKTLPFAIMGMLVVYCLKGVHFGGLSGFLPPLLACLAVGATYVWKRNTLFSIISGTVLYLVLVQFVF
ncbi:MAG: AzlD domain-containing protein [Clostridia bacterium]|nr:AzlD domain-containing protein [Clostridia bacterium]